MLLLLTYRLTWASTSGSFVGHVCRGWMPKERDDLAFHRRVCAIWLPLDPFVSGSISGPGGCSAVLKQKELGKALRTEKNKGPSLAHSGHSSTGASPSVMRRGKAKALPRPRCPTKTAPRPSCTLWPRGTVQILSKSYPKTVQILSHPSAMSGVLHTLKSAGSKVKGEKWACEPSQTYLEKGNIHWGRESSVWSTFRGWTSWPLAFGPGVPGLSPNFHLK